MLSFIIQAYNINVPWGFFPSTVSNLLFIIMQNIFLLKQKCTAYKQRNVLMPLFI